MTHLPASPSSKRLGKAARVRCAYKRGPNLIAGYLHGGGDALFLSSKAVHPILGIGRCIVASKMAENKKIIRIHCGQTMHQNL
jgi:hypothetical protein